MIMISHFFPIFRLWRDRTTKKRYSHLNTKVIYNFIKEKVNDYKKKLINLYMDYDTRILESEP